MHGLAGNFGGPVSHVSLPGDRTGYDAAPMRAISLIAAIALLSAGCLSQSHVIPRHELQALAQTDPQGRGRQVRVVQSFAASEEPPPAPAVDGSANVSVVVVTPVRVESGPRGVVKPRAPSAKSKADDARFWLIVAGIVAVGAALTEGLRYDGWVELHPMHPVHLYGWDGSYTWMPLAHVTPETATWARKAVIRSSEGPWRELGRAPLNRRGWTYALLLGSSEVPNDVSADARGFTSHIQFGHFFSQEIGVLLDVSLGWAENELGDVLYDSRTGLELQFMPLAAGRFHGGGFAQIGAGTRLDDTGGDQDREGLFYGGGAMLQLELTTRLTLTGRAGLTAIYGSTTADFTVGLSIY